MSRVTLQVNGETISVPADWTVADLVDRYASDRGPVAVELNRNILRRDQWPDHRLHEKDSLEIVHFVGGGAA